MTDAELEMRWRDQQLFDNGLLDPGQPTETAYFDHRFAMTREFTPLERWLIRYDLGLGR